MSATGLPVFDKTLQTTNIWLDEIMAAIGPDRQLAWRVLSVVLHTLRDRLSPDLAAHLAAELPLLVRGVFYDQYKPSRQPTTFDLDDFVEEVGEWLSDARPTDPRDAMSAVFATLSRHLPPGQIVKLKQTLPANLRDFWTEAEARVPPSIQDRRGAARQRNTRSTARGAPYSGSGKPH
jgi:uncharacterized protein (DUF2267 family)